MFTVFFPTNYDGYDGTCNWVKLFMYNCWIGCYGVMVNSLSNIFRFSWFRNICLFCDLFIRIVFNIKSKRLYVIIYTVTIVLLSCMWTDIDECAANPCGSNGICVDGIDDFTCQCKPGYTGRRCQIGNYDYYYKVLFLDHDIVGWKREEKNAKAKQQHVCSHGNFFCCFFRIMCT